MPLFNPDNMYKKLLKQAWQIVWQHPFLWFFGLFATFLWGNEFNFLINNFSQFSNWFKNLTGSGVFIFSSFGVFSKIFSLLPGPVLISFIVLAFLGLLFLYLANLSLGAIIFASRKIKDGETTSFRETFKTGIRYSPAVILVNILTYLVIFGLILPQKIPGLHLFLKQLHLTIPFVVIMIILILLTVVVSFLFRFTVCAIVLEKKRVLGGLKRAVGFLIKNYRPTLILTFWLFLISIAAALLVFLILTATSLPFFALSTLFHQIGLSFLFKPLSVILFLISLILVIFLGSILSAYQVVAWTLFFLELKVN